MYSRYGFQLTGDHSVEMRCGEVNLRFLWRDAIVAERANDLMMVNFFILASLMKDSFQLFLNKTVHPIVNCK